MDSTIVAIISGAIMVTSAFYRLNYKIKYIDKVLKKICVKLGIELFDDIE